MKASASRQRPTKNGSRSDVLETQVPPAGLPLLPPPSIYRQYLDDIAAIFAGRISKPEEMYNPPARMNMEKVVRVGRLENPMAREFFSLQFRLKEKAMQLPIPRRADQCAAHSKQVKELMTLANEAAEIGWKFIHEQFPEHCGRGSMAVIDGWLIVRAKDFEDKIREEANARRFLTPEQAEEWVQCRLREKEAKDQETDFDEIERDHRGLSESKSFQEALKGILADRFGM